MPKYPAYIWNRMRILLLISLLMLLESSAAAQKSQDGLINFTSSDTALENGFRWAKLQALKYVRRSNDPVGPWYEAALPEREAFCMRDVAHQLTGANLLGLSDINKNLLIKFAASVSISRDWCGYWEIDKLDRPAPVDYKSDEDFWFNLPGNFDILNAILRQYQWTGDTTFLISNTFNNFYKRTCNDFVTQWDKDGDGIMEGTTSVKNHYRGIGSYDESLPGITGHDLIAAQSVGYRSFAALLTASGRQKDAKIYTDRSLKLSHGFDKTWWDNERQSYYHFKTKDGWLHNNPMQLFLLRWNFISRDKVQPVLQSLLLHEGEMNVEMRSYFALEVFRYGDPSEALRLLKAITSPTLKRREYPEVSFGALEAYAEGLMGIEADAPHKKITTLSRVSANDNAKLSRVPLLDGDITISHEGLVKSIFRNDTKQPLYWNASFLSDAASIRINGKRVTAKIGKDVVGRRVISGVVKVLPGMECIAEVE